MTGTRLEELRKLAEAGSLGQAEQLELIAAIDLFEASNGFSTCSYCHEQICANADWQRAEKVVAHIEGCEKHPIGMFMRDNEVLTKQRDELRATLAATEKKLADALDELASMPAGEN